MRRIVSVVPSITETLCRFGLQDEIVGCTSFCVEPLSLRRTAASIGGTKDASIEKIAALEPSHILVNSEENTAEFIATAKKYASLKNIKLIETFPLNAQDSIAMVLQLAETFSFQAKAADWAQQTNTELQKTIALAKLLENRNYAYFIWREPWMVAGNRSYISNMLSLLGLKNIFQTGDSPHERYPAVSETDAKFASCRYIFFSSEPFPFRERHMDEFLSLSNSKAMCMKVDGQALSWYGSRTLQGLLYLRDLASSLLENDS